MKTLRPYQDDAIARFRGRAAAFFAMEMRLGKTLTCLRWLDTLTAPHPTLIIAPKTVLLSWEKELTEEGHPFISLSGPIADRKQILQHRSKDPARFYLLNIETVSALEVELRQFQFNSIILDESVAIKSPGTQTTKSMLRVSKHVQIRACLSGLPTPKSWFDIWNQMAFLHGGSWDGEPNFWKWRDKVASNFGHDFFISDKQKDRIRALYHRDAFVLSRADAGVGETKVYQTHAISLPKDTRKIYREISREWQIAGASAKQKIVALGWLARVCGGHLPGGKTCPTNKRAALLNLLQEKLADQQVVIWTATTNELVDVWEGCKEVGIPISFVNGESSMQERAARIDAFQSGKIRVLVCHPRCMKYGVDLSAADTAIYYSNLYDYDIRAQTEDRIVKVGKKSPLLYIDMITTDTIEADIYALLQAKKTDAQSLLERFEKSISDPTDDQTLDDD